MRRWHVCLPVNGVLPAMLASCGRDCDAVEVDKERVLIVGIYWHSSFAAEWVGSGEEPEGGVSCTGKPIGE